MHNAGMSETQPPVLEATPDPIQAGRDALARHDWAQAFEQLSQADAGGRMLIFFLSCLIPGKSGKSVQPLYYFFKTLRLECGEGGILLPPFLLSACGPCTSLHFRDNTLCLSSLQANPILGYSFFLLFARVPRKTVSVVSPA